MIAGQILAEGKTKQVRGIPGTPWEVHVRSKDDITAGDGARHDELEGKAAAATATTCNVFEYLAQHGVPSHFVDRVDELTFRARHCCMIPVEVVMRRLAFGSFLKRHPGTVSGMRFDEVTVEFFFKDDAAHDPLLVINSDGTVSLRAADAPLDSMDGAIGLLDGDNAAMLLDTQAEMTRIGRLVFELLETAWASLGHTLVDLKIEFGYDTETGQLVVADVVDNDSWRVWLEGDSEQMVDKQVYRDLGLDEPEVAKRIKGNYALVALLTESFVGL